MFLSKAFVFPLMLGAGLFAEVAVGSMIVPNCDQMPADAFDKAFCAFRAERYDAEDVLGRVQRAQQTGLGFEAQQIATLMEGVIHCDLAIKYGNIYRESAGRAGETRARYCSHRNQARVAFSDLDWKGVAVLDLPFVTSSMEKMAACFEGPLHKDQGASCFEIPVADHHAVDTLMPQILAGAFKYYFDGATAPISAMLERKLARAQGVVQWGESKRVELADHPDKYDAKELSADKKAIKLDIAPLDEIVTAFRKAYLDALGYAEYIMKAENTITERLLVEKFGETEFNHGPGLDVASHALDSRLSELNGEVSEVETLFAKAISQIKSQASNDASMRSLCALYYCAFMEKSYADFTPPNPGHTKRACQDLALPPRLPLSICRPLNANDQNPLLPYGEGESMALKDLCLGAGFNESYIAYKLTNPVMIKACQALIRNPSRGGP